MEWPMMICRKQQIKSQQCYDQELLEVGRNNYLYTVCI